LKWFGGLWDPVSLGVFGIFVFSLVLNLIPFMGPSNLVIAGMMGVLFPDTNPLLIGFGVALGSTIAKTAHYYVVYWVRGKLSEAKRLQLERFRNLVGRWGAVALFVAAVTPVPDEPIVIPMGLMKYSLGKFFSIFFVGKMIIALCGAYAGQYLVSVLSAYFSDWVVIAMTAVFTVAVTIVMVKVDLDEVLRKLRLPK
jgi:membrane protein DedA with SNARE-associated domain